MMVARGDLLLFLDADGATRVTDLDKLEAELEKKLASGEVRQDFVTTIYPRLLISSPLHPLNVQG